MITVGIAWCFNFWIVPIIKLNGSSSAIAQFKETSYRGGIWLEPLNASIAALLAITTLLLLNHPDPAESATWKWYGAASATLVQVAWWERVLIFPIDDSVAAMKDNKENFKGTDSAWLEPWSQAGLVRSMDSWSRRTRMKWRSAP